MAWIGQRFRLFGRCTGGSPGIIRCIRVESIIWRYDDTVIYSFLHLDQGIVKIEGRVILTALTGIILYDVARSKASTRSFGRRKGTEPLYIANSRRLAKAWIVGKSSWSGLDTRRADLMRLKEAPEDSVLRYYLSVHGASEHIDWKLTHRDTSVPVRLQHPRQGHACRDQHRCNRYRLPDLQ